MEMIKITLWDADTGQKLWPIIDSTSPEHYDYTDPAGYYKRVFSVKYVKGCATQVRDVT